MASLRETAQGARRRAGAVVAHGLRGRRTIDELRRELAAARAERASPPAAPPAAHPLEPLLYGGWEHIVPDRSLWVGPGDPLVHFIRWPFEYVAYLTLLCRLRRDASVLEIGCNHGRTAIGLLDYLRPPGRYEGLDILPRQVEYAQSHLHAYAPHFSFTLADIRNDVYNPAGTLDSATYRFPYDDGSFDCVYAASVFTHLLPDATANYLRETARVLSPGSRCLLSFFIRDFYEGPGTSAHELYEFDGRVEGHDGVGVRDPSAPEAVIAYDRALVEDLATAAGLSVVDVIPGYWAARGPFAVNEQDLVVLEAGR